MATYAQIYDIAHDSEFRKRVQTAAMMISRDILNDGNPEKFGGRYTLARQAMRLDEPVVDRFAWECALNPTVAADETASPGSTEDSNLAFVVSSTWDSVAEAG